MTAPITASPPQKPNKIMQFLGNMCPSITKCDGKKIQKIALEALKFLACVIIGVAAGGLIGLPIGATPIIVGAVLGGLTGGIAYFATICVIKAIQANGYSAYSHRTHAPVSLEKLTSSENLEVFKDVLIDHFSDKPWFQAWKARKGKHRKNMFNMQSKKTTPFTNDEAANYLVGKGISKGVSFAEAQELLKLTKTHPDLKGEDLIRRLRIENLFQRQILELLRFEVKEPALVQEVEDLRNHIPGLDMIGDPLTIDFKNMSIFKTTFSNFIQGKNAIGATLELVGKTRRYIFIRLTEPYSFYDPFSKKYTGLHENFKSEEAFIDTLYRHLRGYQRSWRGCHHPETGILKLYR